MKSVLYIIASSLFMHMGYATTATWSIDAGGNGHTYEVVLSGFSWEAGNILAQNRGGYLATITSPAENDFVLSLIRDPEFWTYTNGYWDGPWIGGFQQAGSNIPNQGWQWVTGEVFAFSDWHLGQPDDFDGITQNRLHFWDYGTNLTFEQIRPQWDDVESFTPFIRAVVIEYSPVPEPDSLMLGTVAGIALLALTSRRLLRSKRMENTAQQDAAANP